jgi:uncharacterized membrane protein
MPLPSPAPPAIKKFRPFRSAVIRGLGVLIPPLLTVVILVWVINTTRVFLLEPVNAGAREGIAWLLSGDIREDLPITDRAKGVAIINEVPYQECPDHRFVPLAIYEKVQNSSDAQPLPRTAKGILDRYVELSYLQPQYSIPCLLAVFILLVYLLGKFIAAGIGGFIVHHFEVAIERLPLVRNVYKATKQVSDFFFSERQIQFSRVVAVEYPRPGMWSLAFVTSDGLSDIRTAANEPVLGVFIPSSPMPLSGYALVVLKREAIDLNITIEEAIQYLVSCGLVMPLKDVQRLKKAEGQPAIEAAGPA